MIWVPNWSMETKTMNLRIRTYRMVSISFHWYWILSPKILQLIMRNFSVLYLVSLDLPLMTRLFRLLMILNMDWVVPYSRKTLTRPRSWHSNWKMEQSILMILWVAAHPYQMVESKTVDIAENAIRMDSWKLLTESQYWSLKLDYFLISLIAINI